MAGMYRVEAFTLVELLVAVAVVAVLAALALPNFLAAQTRSKTARARADMRTLSTALEVYHADGGSWPPNDGKFNIVPVELSTPVAYLSSTATLDPFSIRERHPVHGERAAHYTYQLVVAGGDVARHVLAGNNPPVEAIDAPGLNPGAAERYGSWKLASNGPDRLYSAVGTPGGPWNPHPHVLLGADIPYDPTNGTASLGNIVRTRKSAEGPPP